jgi:hypothetical protein
VVHIQIVANSGTARQLCLSQIGTRLGFALTAEFIRQLGFEAVGGNCDAVLYDEHDFSTICTALVNHIVQVQLQVRQAALLPSGTPHKISTCESE